MKMRLKSHEAVSRWDVAVAVQVEEKLESARYDTIVVLGIGGYVKAKDFLPVFDEIDADTFAKIMYATGKMLDDFDGAEAVNPQNIPLTIARYDFEQERHFEQVIGIFRKHFEPGVVRV